MNCPVCDDAEMNEEAVADATIDRCPDRHGIWLDELGLEKLLREKPRHGSG